MSTPPATPTGLTHACARCGAPVPLDVGLCERCNPLGLRDVSSSQAHGTVFVAVGLAVLVLALVGVLSVKGIGPFPAEVVAFHPAGDGFVVSVKVTNSGTSLGSTTCRISDPDGAAGLTAFIQTPRIAPGTTEAFDATVTGIGTKAKSLAIECSSP
jgi:hypothetical protein